MPHKHACQMTLVGEPTTNSNLTEWRSAFVLCQSLAEPVRVN